MNGKVTSVRECEWGNKDTGTRRGIKWGGYVLRRKLYVLLAVEAV